MKKIVLLIVLVAGILLPVCAEQLTTVAVVDTAKVYTAFFRESQAVRDLERAKQTIQDELDRYQAELKKLQADKLTAMTQNNAPEALRLDQEINNKQQFIGEYRKVKQQQLLDQQKNLLQSDSFLAEITAAIKYTAESEGYTVVLDSSDKNLRFWSADVDITDKVLNYLRRSVTR